MRESLALTVLNKVILHFLQQESDKDKRRTEYFKSSKHCESYFVGGSLIFVVPFLSIDFLIPQKRKKSPNIDQHICSPDKETDIQSHDK